MSPRRPALIALGVVLAVAAVEWVAAARAYRRAISGADWRALDAHLAAIPGDEAIVLAERWLGPRARLEVPRLRRWSSAAPPDLAGWPRFHVVSLGGEPWTRDLRGEWPEWPLGHVPEASSRDHLGPFTIHHFSPPGAAETVADLLEGRLEVRDARGRCPERAGGFACKQGRVERVVAEVTFTPRRCLRLAVDDGDALTIRAPAALLGDTLRGHLGFDDFNARLRSDAPLLLTIAVDGARIAELTLSDAQGWAAFEAPTPAGRHDLTITVLPTSAGTWGDRGYQDRPLHAPCLELRSLRHPGGAG
ncbi:MAG: hypothetical protein R3B09_02520 [Nannocystaceae bacterium]